MLLLFFLLLLLLLRFKTVMFLLLLLLLLLLFVFLAVAGFIVAPRYSAQLPGGGFHNYHCPMPISRTTLQMCVRTCSTSHPSNSSQLFPGDATLLKLAAEGALSIDATRRF